MTTRTTGEFTFDNWEETTVGPAEDGLRLARASVTNTFSGGIRAAGTTCEYLVAYTEGKTGTFNGFELLSGDLDGRKGVFAIEQRGTFDEDNTVHCTFEVVPGSGTGELAGLSGTGRYTARHGEPATSYTFEYSLG